MTFPILYSFRRCPYAIRARLAILVSGMTCQLREVSLANKPSAMILASPKATVPIIVLPNGQVMDESLDIMGFALDHHDRDGWRVAQSDPVMALVARNDGEFKNHLDRYKYPQKYNEDPVAHRDAGLAILIDLNSRLSEHEFLTGHQCSMVDIAIFPFVRQFAAIDPTWFGQQPIPELATWLMSFSKSAPFAIAMTTVPIWTPGDKVTFFPDQ